MSWVKTLQKYSLSDDSPGSETAPDQSDHTEPVTVPNVETDPIEEDYLECTIVEDEGFSTGSTDSGSEYEDAVDVNENDTAEDFDFDGDTGMEPTENGGNDLDKISRKRKITRHKTIDSNLLPYTYTPLSCFRMLTETGFVFNMTMRIMKNASHPEYYNHRWRVEIMDSRNPAWTGVGEAPRKILAKEAAVLDLLENLKVIDPGFSVPKCRIQKGSRITPSVEAKLVSLCVSNGWPKPVYKTQLLVSNNRECYRTTIIVNDQFFTDKSYNEFFAKIQALFAAYNALAPEPIPLYDYYSGSDECLSVDLFGVVESEQFHLVSSPSLHMLDIHQALLDGAAPETFPGPALVAALKYGAGIKDDPQDDSGSVLLAERPYSMISSASGRTSPSGSVASDIKAFDDDKSEVENKRRKMTHLPEACHGLIRQNIVPGSEGTEVPEGQAGINVRQWVNTLMEQD